MNEEITNETDEAVETSEIETPSLDDIAGEFKVEEQIQNFNVQPNQQIQPPGNQWAPDPIADPSGFERYSREQSEVLRTVNETVKSLSDKVSAYEKQMAQQKVDAEVDKAVARINKKLNVDPLVAEIYLEKEYRTNPSFKKIWDLRGQNPKAFERALDVIASKGAPIFANKQDPQLTENQIAARKSQKTMANAPRDDKDSEWDNLSDAEFAMKWGQKMRG